MGSIGPGELLIIALIALLLFGAGRIADIGKGLGQGIKNFKQGLKDPDDDKPAAEAKPAALPAVPVVPVAPVAPAEKKEA
jgi:sec-independent protein translocase protein TatA